MTIVPFDLADVTDTYHTYAAGPDADDGFGINTEYTAQDMNEAVTTVFDRATQTLEENTGDTYTCIGELGSDSLSSKHAFLALKNAEDPKTARWAVMTIYEPGSDVSLIRVRTGSGRLYLNHNRAPIITKFLHFFHQEFTLTSHFSPRI
ncbi:MAG: hypothetical protein SPL40_06250 [Erysipelotrichaceae bacterium]|nr:hypothetical protein [Erysipelotrichaceae bacterium]